MRLGRILLALAPPDRRPPASSSSPAGGLPFDALYPSTPGAGIAQVGRRPPYSIAAATSSAILAAANPARRGLELVNDSTADLYLVHGSVASTVGYTVKVAAGGLYVIGPPGAYQGDVAGVWSAVNGSARVTELTT